MRTRTNVWRKYQRRVRSFYFPDLEVLSWLSVAVEWPNWVVCSISITSPRKRIRFGNFLVWFASWICFSSTLISTFFLAISSWKEASFSSFPFKPFLSVGLFELLLFLKCWVVLQIWFLHRLYQGIRDFSFHVSSCPNTSILDRMQRHKCFFI